MLKICALNDYSSSDSDQSDSEIRTKEAQEDEAFQLYNSALRLQRTSQWEEAEASYKELLLLDFVDTAPTKGNDFLVHPGARLKYSCLKNLGDLSLEQEKLEETLEYYLKALELDSRDVGLWYKMGNVAERVSDFYLAKNAYQEGLECSPHHWLCLDKIICMTHLVGDYISCLLYVSRALSRAPGYIKGHIIKNEIFKEQPSLREDIKLFGDPSCDLFMEWEVKSVDVEKYQEEYNQKKQSMARPRELPSLSAVKFNKSLYSYTWQSVGICLNALYDHIIDTNGQISIASPVNVEELLERGLQPQEEAKRKTSRHNSIEEAEERAVTGAEDSSVDEDGETGDNQAQKKNPKKKKGLWQELLELEKRRSTRMRSGLPRRSIDFSYAETLLKMLPASLQHTDRPQNNGNKNLTSTRMKGQTDSNQESKDKAKSGSSSSSSTQDKTYNGKSKNKKTKHETPDSTNQIVEIDIADSDEEEKVDVEMKEDIQNSNKDELKMEVDNEVAGKDSQLLESSRDANEVPKEEIKDEKMETDSATAKEKEENTQEISSAKIVEQSATDENIKKEEVKEEKADTVTSEKTEVTSIDTDVEKEKSVDCVKNSVDATPKDELKEENEETAVKSFLSKFTKGEGVLEILYGFVLEVAEKPVLRSQSMILVYCEAYYKARTHYPHPCVLTSEIDDPLFYPDAIASLVYAEMCFETHKKRKSRYILQPDSRKYQEELAHLEFAFASENSEKLMTKGENPHPHRARLFWMEAQVAVTMGKSEDAFCWNDHLRRLMEKYEESTGNTIQLNMNYGNKDTNFAINDVEKELQFLGRNQKLGDVLTLYENEEYECVVELISSTFGTSQVNVPQGNSDVPERHVQLKLLIGALTQLGNFKRLVHLSCVCLEEALCQFDSPDNDSCMRTVWGETVTHILLVLDNSMQKMEDPFREVDRVDIGQLSHQLIRVITVGLEIADFSSEILMETITPWILLHRIFMHEENSKDEVELLDDGNPASLTLLNTGHDWLGKKSWCCNANGTFLLYIMDTLLKTLKEAPTQLPYAEEIQLALEQCFYCLYAYPGKKTKARHLADHNVHQIRLMWDRAYQLYHYFRPIELPEYDSYLIKGLNADGEVLFNRILDLVPLNIDDVEDRKELVAERLVEVQQYIEGNTDEVPNFPDDLADHSVMGDLYYLLADYYLKCTEWGKAIKHYQLDICVNSHRVDSWAGLALARMGSIEKKLNLCFVVKGDESMYKRSKLALRCFQRTMELDPDTPKMWIEYGALAYVIHSFASRQLKMEHDSMSLEKFAMIEEEKDQLLNTALDCFNKARTVNITQEGILDEQWLLDFMTGKVYEKKGKAPKDYLELYEKARVGLHENGAKYPSNIDYQYPPFGSVEALEVFYRMHACILKALLHAEGQPLDADVRELYLQYLKNLNESPLVQNQTTQQQNDEGSGLEAGDDATKEEVENDGKDGEEKMETDAKEKANEAEKKEAANDSDSDVIIIDDDDDEDVKVRQEEKVEEKGHTEEVDIEKEDTTEESGSKKFKEGSQDCPTENDNKTKSRSQSPAPPSPIEFIKYDDGDGIVKMAMEAEIKEALDDLIGKVEEQVKLDSNAEEEMKSKQVAEENEDSKVNSNSTSGENSKNKDTKSQQDSRDDSRTKNDSSNREDSKTEEDSKTKSGNQSDSKISLLTPQKSKVDEEMESLMKLNQELERIKCQNIEEGNSSEKRKAEDDDLPDAKRRGSVIVENKAKGTEEEVSPKRSTPIQDESNQKNVFDHYELVSPCLKALALCTDRFEQHYKSQFRLAHYYATSKYHKNLKWSRDLLLGTRGQWQDYQHMPNKGLFSGRRPSNLFEGIWRIPNNEVDRPGSFAAHMYRCINLLIDVSAQLSEQVMLFSIASWLSTKPDREKMYLYEARRKMLGEVAYTEGMRVLRVKIHEAFPASKTAAKAVPANKQLVTLLDVYRAYRKMAKDVPSKVPHLRELLEDTYKKFRRGKVESSGSMIEQAKCFCERQINVMEKRRIATVSTRGRGRGRGRGTALSRLQKVPETQPTTSVSTTATTQQTTAATKPQQDTTTASSTSPTNTTTTSAPNTPTASNKPRNPIGSKRRSLLQKIAKETGWDSNFLIDMMETPASEEEVSPNPPGFRKHGSPVGTTAKRTSSPARTSTPPVRKTRSPARTSTPPVRKTNSPARTSTPPVRKTSSPARTSTPPIRKTSSPIPTSIPRSTAQPEVSIIKATSVKQSLKSFRRSSTSSRTTNTTVQSTAPISKGVTNVKSSTSSSTLSVKETATGKATITKVSAPVQKHPPPLQRSRSIPASRPKPSLTAQAISSEKINKKPDFVKKFGSDVPSSGKYSSSVNKLRNIRLMKQTAKPTTSSSSSSAKEAQTSKSSSPKPTKRPYDITYTPSSSSPNPPKRLLNLGSEITIKHIKPSKVAVRDDNVRLADITKNRSITVTTSSLSVAKKQPTQSADISKIVNRYKNSSISLTQKVVPSTQKGSSQDEVITLD